MDYYDNFKKFGDRLAAVQSDGKQITYAQIEDFADRIGEIMPSRSLVFCLCRNVIGSMCGYLSFLHNRSVPLMLDAKTDSVLLNNLIDIYKPSFLYVPCDIDGNFPDYAPVHEEFDYVLLKTGFEVKYELNENLALLLATSGSTGSPKLVRQSYKNIQSNAEAIVGYLKIDENERPITTLPMNYTYGLSIINSHILAGATILLTTDTVVAKSFWDFLKEKEATSFGGVPYTYEMLKRIRFFRMTLPSLKYFTQAGGKLSPELHKEFAQYAAENGKKFIVMYGQTEATARMGYLPYEMSVEKYGSMGVTIPGGKFSLIDVDGNVIDEPEKVGELVYEGDNVTLGYAECGEDLLKGDERNGKLETGDMAKRDADGYYFIVGRKKRFLKLFGNRINLDEVDLIVKREFHGVDVASTGTDELMTVYITDASLEKEIFDVIVERTHINARAVKVTAIESIPRNEAGKVLYEKIKTLVSVG